MSVFNFQFLKFFSDECYTFCVPTARSTDDKNLEGVIKEVKFGNERLNKDSSYREE